MFFTLDGVTIALQGSRQTQPHGPTTAEEARELAEPAAQSVVNLRFVGADSSPRLESGQLLPGKVNYLLGPDPSAWRTGLPMYAGVTYSGLYPGIDLAYSGDEGNLKGTYTVAAGADPSRIVWRYEGVEKVTVESNGDLRIAVTGSAALTEKAPVAWQEFGGARVPVGARYVVATDGAVSLALDAYDKREALVIDPTLTYSTYLGGGGADTSLPSEVGKARHS
jgi:hypothetical protein